MIYTRTGDKGTTSLVGGTRVPKTHARLEAYGTVDELNSFIGMLISLIDDKQEIDLLLFVQHQLFVVGAYLATDQTKMAQASSNLLHEEDVVRLESAIDRLDAELPTLKAFILPGGSFPASVCHVCRTVCRRAERCILSLEEHEICEIDTLYKSFINRLSDYLFVLSRKLNVLANKSENFWINTCK